MKPVNKALVITIALAALIAGVMFAKQSPRNTAAEDPGAVNAPISADDPDMRPLFSLLGTDGETHNISQWDGKVLAINFWATWCGPCRKEIPEFIEMQNEYGDAGVQFVGVAIDSLEKVTAYSKEFGINYPLLVGDEDAIAVGFAYGNDIGALPYTAIVDRSGRIVLRKQGVLTHDEAVKVIKALL
jgi:thiol-disulfide isomerase/thioredoxin